MPPAFFSWYSKIVNRLLSEEITTQVNRALLVSETDNSLTIGARRFDSSERDRYEHNRNEILEQSLEAWRVNPLARRIVELTTQYVVGGGLSISSKDKKTAEFLDLFWTDRLNRMDTRCYELCDELTRSGNLFILLSTDESGMSYIRAYPAANIEEIKSRENDIEQPVSFIPKADATEHDPTPYPAYDPFADTRDESGKFKPVMLHYAINRPVGAQWGEPDLAPLLRWLSRYSNWLEDRARLNRFRTAFLYIVKGIFNSEAERVARQQQLNANPPNPGSILVTNESETWDTLSARLDSKEANEDGLSIKKMIASGAGLPMHFLAEPESATRTTAEAAGGPTYRHFEQRQLFFKYVLTDILRVALRRRAQVENKINPRSEIVIQAGDISARDNVSLAIAATNIITAVSTLRDRNLIDDAEMLRMIYRFSGEPVDVEEMLERGRKAPKIENPNTKGLTPPNNPIDPKTGNIKPSALGDL